MPAITLRTNPSIEVAVRGADEPALILRVGSAPGITVGGITTTGVSTVEVLDAVGVIDLVAEYDADDTGVTACDEALDVAVARLLSHTTVFNRTRKWQLRFGPGTFKIAAAHAWNGLMDCEIVGAGQWATRLLCSGAGLASNHIFDLRNPRHVRFRDFSFETNGINVSSLIRSNRVVGQDVYTAGMCQWERLRFYGGTVGGDYVIIDGDPFHNDYHYFKHVAMEGVAPGQRSGICIDSQQQKGTIFDQCIIGSCGSAIYCVGQNGSFEWRGGFLYTNADADFTFEDGVGDPVTIHGAWRSEGSARMINNFSDSGNPFQLTVRDGTWTTQNLHADGYWMRLGKCGPTLIQGVTVGIADDDPEFRTPQIYVQASTPAELAITHCAFDTLDSVDVDPVAHRMDAIDLHVIRHSNWYRTGGLSRTPARRPDEAVIGGYEEFISLP